MAQTGHWMAKGWTPAADTVIPASTGSNGSFTVGTGSGTVLTNVVAGPLTIAYAIKLNTSGVNNQLCSASVSIPGSASDRPYFACWAKLDATPVSGTTGRILFVSNEDLGMISNHTNATFRGAAYTAADSFKAASYGSPTWTNWNWFETWRDGTNVVAAINGTIVNQTASTGGTSGSSSIQFGNVPGANQPGRLAICDVRVWNTIPTTAERLAMYSSAFPTAQNTFRIGIGMGI